jgi:regulator of sirC expression with transglutaminase-like and TPR domain
MNANTSTEADSTLSDAQRTALISLLADDDARVHQEVRRKLMSYGPVVVDWLKPYSLNNDPALRRRTREIVTHFKRLDSDVQFLDFCSNQGEDLDLEMGVGLLARTKDPEVHLGALNAQLDQFGAELRARLQAAISPQQKLLAINHFLFIDQGFHGNPNYETNVENCYFNRIMERKTGNPIGLCALYLFVCRRLGLPVTGIGLPGHFICRFQSPILELYIDCFHHGRFLMKADCIQHLHATNHGLHEGYLAPVSTRRILMRMCANLQQTYLQAEQTEEAARVKRYLIALAS